MLKTAIKIGIKKSGSMEKLGLIMGVSHQAVYKLKVGLSKNILASHAVPLSAYTGISVEDMVVKTVD